VWGVTFLGTKGKAKGEKWPPNARLITTFKISKNKNAIMQQ